MSSPPPKADPELLKKLVLGQLPSAQAEQLAAECVDDSRIAELAESLGDNVDTVMNLLPHQDTVVDPDDELLVLRMQQRLKAALPVPAVAATQSAMPAAVPAATPPLPARLEYYQPLSILGQGGMGTVYLALDTRLGREVALKTLRPDQAADSQAKERFLREARAAAKLSHDHLVPIFYVGEADGVPFLAMPLLKGETLEALLKRRTGPLPIEQTLRIAHETAAGLAAAHDAGLIHRDIKPSNLWLEAPGGRVKVLDFGLAKAAGTGADVQDETHLTSCGTVVGTPAYMAPEQARGQTLDGRADLFSLGCVLYEALTGARPFGGSDTMAILMNLAMHTPPAPQTLNPACPAELSQLVMQLLEKDPANRPASAHAVIDALTAMEQAPFADDTAILPASTVVSASDLPPANVQPLPASSADVPAQPRSHRIALAAGGALMLLLAFVIFRVQTDQGTLVVEINDPAVQVLLEKDGLVIRDKDSDRTWTITTATEKPLPSGKYQVEGQPNLHLMITDDTGTELTAESFSLKRKGEVRVTVTLEDARAAVTEKGTAPATTPAVGSDADRRAAEYVLSIGSTIKIIDQGLEVPVHTLAGLPNEPFQLTGVTLAHNDKITDEGLAVFENCRNLTALLFRGNEVTDARLANFRNCKKLRVLDLLWGTAVTDAGLANFMDCPDLTILVIQAGRGVTKAGLSHFRECKQLVTLWLFAERVTDEGIANFSNLTKLEELTIHSPISGVGLSQFKACKQLRSLSLVSGHLNDADLRVFEECKNLTELSVYFTPIDGSGLVHFRESKKLASLGFSNSNLSDEHLLRLADYPLLTSVDVRATKVTEAGVKKLAAALPGCKIEWDGGVIEPKSSADPDRRAAEYVLSIGGHINFNGIATAIGAVDQLPRGPFELTGVTLDGNMKVTDAGLSAFAGCRNLTFLNLYDTPISDAGLASFKDCKKLTSLRLKGEEISDLGLANFKGCKDLTLLHLYGQDLSNAGMANFKDCRNLKELNLAWTQVSDAGLTHFENCTDLTNLVVFECPVTDAGLAHFQNCKQLTDLALFSRVATSAGLVHFRECQSLKNLSLSGMPQMGDAGVSHFKDCENLTVLDLSNAGVSDVALNHLQNCKNLASLNLIDTKVSDAGIDRLTSFLNLNSLFIERTKITEPGVKKLSIALPACRIQWDGGVIEPTGTPAAVIAPLAARKADAEKPFVLIRGGKEFRSFKGFEGVLAELNPEDVIELRANGPVRIAAQEVLNKPIDLRAAEGYRPQLELQGVVRFVGGSLRITGCDIFSDQQNQYLYGGNGTAAGDAGPWEFHQCRFLQGINYSGGPGIKFTDSLVIAFHGMALPRGGTCSMQNCVIVGHTCAFQGDGATFHLRQCTVAANSLLNQPGAESLLKFDVEDCLIRASFMPSDEATWRGGMPKWIEWSGKNNCYYAGPVYSANNKVVAEGLTAWETYLGHQEPGSRIAEWSEFRFGLLRPDESSLDKTVAFYRQRIDQARQSTGIKDLGPEVTLIGPGEGYLRSLASVGKPVSNDDIRPERLSGGPFTLLHDSESPRGYPSLQAAVKASQDGDTIEIRSDTEFTEHAIEGAVHRLTIRGAAGYLPINVGGIRMVGLEQATFENLCFRDGNLGAPVFDDAKKIFPTKGSLARVANCAFLPETWSIHRFVSLENADAEVVNCIGGIQAGLLAGETLSVSNCVGRGIRVYIEDASACTLRVDRCYWLNNDQEHFSSSLFLNSSDDRDDVLTAHVSRTAHDVISHQQINLFGRSDKDFRWKGERNLYRSLWSFATLERRLSAPMGSPFALNLAHWQEFCHSDADSMEQPSRLFDPASWRLMSNSVGYRTINDRDCGADVDRILTPSRD